MKKIAICLCLLLGQAWGLTATPPLSWREDLEEGLWDVKKPDDDDDTVIAVTTK